MRTLIAFTLLAGYLMGCGGPVTTRGLAPQSPEQAHLLGDWIGDSICQVKDSPCHDERVIYHISQSKDSDKVTVAADKIVDGKAVNMGTLEFIYNAHDGTLICEFERGVFRFKIKENAMDGTLTLTDKTLYRLITLGKKH